MDSSEIVLWRQELRGKATVWDAEVMAIAETLQVSKGKRLDTDFELLTSGHCGNRQGRNEGARNNEGIQGNSKPESKKIQEQP